MEKKAVVAAVKKGCCKKKEMMKGSCHAEPPALPAKPAGKPARECCQPTETTCVCICCFQFMAPQQDLQPFQLASFITFIKHTGYIQTAPIEPPLFPPWQPPDLV